MDDKLFEEMLQEIEAMTTAEYWSLYKDAEKLADFPPEDSTFIPVPSSISNAKAVYRSFNNTLDNVYELANTQDLSIIDHTKS